MAAAGKAHPHGHLSGRIVVLVAAVWVAYTLLLVRSPCPRLLDLAWLPTAEQTQQLLLQCGAEGRRLYQTVYLPVDLGFALLWACTVAALLAWAGVRPTALVLLPFAAMALDWAENAAVWQLLAAFPERRPLIAGVVALITAAKLLLAGAAMLLATALLPARLLGARGGWR